MIKCLSTFHSNKDHQGISVCPYVLVACMISVALKQPLEMRLWKGKNTLSGKST